MIFVIICNVCQSTMGTVEKESLSTEDNDLYQQMMQCTNGHILTSDLVENPQE